MREQVARCAFIANPVAALDCWDVLQTLPQTARFAIDYYNKKGQLPCVARLPHVLEVLARANALEQLRLLLLSEETAPLYVREDYTRAIDTAQQRGFGATVAFLLDAQARRFGGSRVTARPNLAL